MLEENNFVDKYCDKYVKITTKDEMIFGLVNCLERSCDSDSGNTEIYISPVDKTYCIPVEDTEIESIEIVSKEDCIGKAEEPLNK